MIRSFKRFLKGLIAVCAGAFILAPASLAAPDVKKVSGSFTYYGDKNDSPVMAKRKALEGARIDALSREFGTIVAQDIQQADRIDSKGENSKFFLLSSTEVKGEWIADAGEPSYVVSLGNDDCLIVSCRVSGTAKSISNNAVDFQALALRNGSTKGNASTEYHTGDDLFLYFSTPVEGYLQVYLMMENGEVLKMLPYINDPSQEVKVKKDYDYVFFDPNRPSSFGEVDPFGISTNGEIEFNKLYVVFSPSAFARPVMKTDKYGAIPYLSEEEFTKWMVKNRRNDPKMGVKQINLKLYPNKL